MKNTLEIKNQKIALEKTRLIHNEPVNKAVVRDMIERSWKRSQLHNISLDNTACIFVSDIQLKRLLEEHSFLIDCSQKIFKKMFSTSHDVLSTMSLSDKNGITLAVVKPENAAASAAPDAEVGIISREEIIGTNGIGTCIAEGYPIEILGAEHFRTISEQSSCAAAPIVNEQNELIAVLNVGVKSEYYHRHTFSMVKAAAYAISEQMLLHTVLTRLQKIINLLDDGIIVLNRSGIIQLMNDNATELIGLKEPVLNRPLSSIMRNSPFLYSLISETSPVQDKEARFDFLTQPAQCIYSILPYGNEIILTLRKSKRMRKLAVKMVGNRAEYVFENILGNSDSLLKAIKEAKIVSQNATTVLLLGESGTGKELFAQSIHNNSPYRVGPFISVNCGAIPRALLESELFGYEEGTFTGASKSGRVGKFELASGGTIFLDEIGEMPLDAQIALLQVIQNREVTRIGGTKSYPIDARIIAATNKDLAKMVKEGTFREDLFYRLNVFPINIPPLRERKGDIRILANSFLTRTAKLLNKNCQSFSEDVLEILEQYPWTGNIRELENVVERMVNLVDQPVITKKDLPSFISQQITIAANKKSQTTPKSEGKNTVKLSSFRNKQEADFILETLQSTGNNIRKTAELLGISRPYLYQKMKKLGLDINSFRNKK